MPIDRRNFIGLTTGALMALAPLSVQAQADYPSEPLRIIVPTGPGGSTDILARAIQAALGEVADFPSVVVVNQPGGGGTIGTRVVKDARPDGYTIGVWHPGFVTSRAMGVVDYDHNDFTILGGTYRSSIGFGIRADSEYKTPLKLIEAAKKDPRSIVVATNIGLPVHFFPLGFAKAAGVEFKFLQTGGGAKRLASVLGGHADIAQFGGLELTQQGEAGLRPLVFFSKERDAAFPDVPTAIESGVDFSVDIFHIFFAPVGLEPEVEAKLNEALQKALMTEAVQERLKSLNADPSWMTDEAVIERLDAVDKFVTPLVDDIRNSK